jgi:DNA repair exonuclease SbcCD ATPase subunit
MAQNATGEDIAASLEEAIAGETETPAVETIETEAVETAETEVTGKAKAIPYSRFKEVVGQKNEVQSQLNELQTQYNDVHTSLSRMTNMLDEAKGDSELVRDIRALASDPEMLPHLEALDAKLKGEELPTAEETGDPEQDALNKAKRVLEAKQAQLEEQISTQAEDILAQRADAIADKWLEALPSEYNEQDREVVSKLWANAVDWDDVKANPSGLDDYLAKTFQETIEVFGTPRGSLINPADPDSYEIEIDSPQEVTPEQEIAQIVSGREYAATTKSDTGAVSADVSDSDFAADLAKIMKINNAR